MRDNPYLCSFHVPKTGGTTFLAHARNSLGDRKVLLHGPHSRMDRFMHDLPQFEELSDSQRESIKIVHGHGAGLAFAEAMRGRMPEFMVFFRDPYERFVSGFHHFNNEKRNSGLGSVSEEKYLNTHGDNFYARLFASHFGPLTPQVFAGSPSKDEVTLEKVVPFMRCFKYILITENLDRQLPQLCRLYGFDSGAIEARRVNKSKSELAIGKDKFEQLNSVDTAIYSVLRDAAARSANSIENPFGFRPDALKDYLERVWSKQTAEERLATAYDNLVSASKRTLRLQAIHSKLMFGKASHVADRQLLLDRVNAVLPDWLQNLSNEKASVAHFWSGVVLMKERKLDAAEERFQAAIRLNPKNDNALAHLAKVLHRRGKRQDAAGYINQALALRPDRQSTQAIRKLVLG